MDLRRSGSFWSLTPAQIRANAAAVPNHIRVRNGQASRSPAKHPFTASYFDLVQKIAPFLPDLDIAINRLDEPRALVTWTAIMESMDSLTASLDRQNLTRPPPKITYRHLSDSSVEPNERCL